MNLKKRKGFFRGGCNKNEYVVDNVIKKRWKRFERGIFFVLEGSRLESLRCTDTLNTVVVCVTTSEFVNYEHTQTQWTQSMYAWWWSLILIVYHLYPYLAHEGYYKKWRSKGVTSHRQTLLHIWMLQSQNKIGRLRRLDDLCKIIIHSGNPIMGRAVVRSDLKEKKFVELDDADGEVWLPEEVNAMSVCVCV